jgi:DNA primase
MANTNVEQIKARLSVSDVLSSYIKIEKSGINYKARCPFHNEKTASFYISPGRGSYYCFGCGAKGDIFSFVQAYEGLDFKGALKVLADRAGVPLTGFKAENTDEKEKLFAVMESATAFYEDELKKHPEVLKYLYDRGLTDETIASFRIGFAPDGWRTLSTHLAEKKFPEAILEKAGLIKQTEKGFYDRFRNRAMFPIMDSTGRIIAFSGRTMVADDATPKYLNSPDTPLFDKSSALYGIDRAKEAIRKRDYAIVVEGQFDLLLSHQAGLINTVAASGTALSDNVPSGDRGVTNLQMISRFSKNILFGFDGDKAGINAAYRGSILALGLGMDVKVAKLPTGKDPADVIREDKELWLRILKSTEPAVSFFAKHIMETERDAREQIKKIQKLVLPLVAKIPSALIREHFLGDVEKITGTTVAALKSDLNDIEKETKAAPITEEKSETGDRTFSLAERLYGIVFWQEAATEPIVQASVLEDKLKSALGGDRAMLVRDTALERKEELIFEAEAGFGADQNLEREFDLMARQLQVRELKRSLDELSRQIREGEKTGQDVSALLEEVREKTTILHTLET